MNLKTFIFSFALLLVASFSFGAKTPVERYGQLSIKGNHVVDSKGNPVQLTGMALYWSQWKGGFYNADCVKWLVDDWKCSIVRASIAIGGDGYAKNPDVEMAKVNAVVDAAIKEGIYVIIDFHEHGAERYVKEAREFFGTISKKYGNVPNIIYELYNEPIKSSWKEDLKPYHEDLISIIRKNDPDNIIICGTRTWSQEVQEAADDPIDQPNIAYTLHFYAGTHGQDLKDKLIYAMDKGICIIVSEYGTTLANGNGGVFEEKTQAWYDLLDKYKISHCAWSVADLEETSAALVPGADVKGGWKDDQISRSGKFVRAELIKKNKEMNKKK